MCRLVDRELNFVLLRDATLSDVEENQGAHPLGAPKNRHEITVRREREVSALTGSDGQTLRHEVAVLIGQTFGEVLVQLAIRKPEYRDSATAA